MNNLPDPPDAPDPPGALTDAELRYIQITQLQSLMEAIDEIFNGDLKGADRDVGFVLMVFPVGGGMTACNLMSNGADTRNLTALTRTLLAQLEAAEARELTRRENEHAPGHA